MTRNYSLRITAVLIATFFWGVVLSFKDYFFFNPMDGENTLRDIELLVSTAGWIVLSTVVPMVLLLIEAGQEQLIRWLPALGLLWPVSVFVTQITLRIQYGQFYLYYLWTYPVFIVTEIILPLSVLYLWRQLQAIHFESLLAAEPK
jgi:hypothetical protein